MRSSPRSCGTGTSTFKFKKEQSKMPNFVPADGRILVRPRVQEKVTSSGIFIPDSAKKVHNNEGEVIASAPGNAYVEGDVVVFGPYAGEEITVDDEKLLLLRVDGSANEVWGKHGRG